MVECNGGLGLFLQKFFSEDEPVGRMKKTPGLMYLPPWFSSRKEQLKFISKTHPKSRFEEISSRIQQVVETHHPIYKNLWQSKKKITHMPVRNDKR